jgi:quinol monooxygenase YgiN
MIVVKVNYTVRPEYVEKNKQNIKTFMADFKNLNNDEFRYIVHVGADRQTFYHISMYQNTEIQKALLDVPSFKSFQQQRDDSGLEGEPQIEVLQTVDASYQVF